MTQRSNCWYGKDCNTQTHNLIHAKKLNHICDNVKNSSNQQTTITTIQKKEESSESDSSDSDDEGPSYVPKEPRVKK